VIVSNPQDTSAMTLPTDERLPPYPAFDATDAEKDQYGRQFHEFQAHTQRRAVIAAELNAATYAREIEMRATPETLEQRKRAMIETLAKVIPQRATDTPNSYFDALATMANQYLSEHGA
jgi:serine phosphatase RsbU (regulator of sigma subunit)